MRLPDGGVTTSSIYIWMSVACGEEIKGRIEVTRH